ncbi:MAG TPA: chromate efflux transporter [Thermoanaerobaculia bacterium]|jgi:chromate transporter|nr:chromate efflux transporter [Thermoanaerobaculia bacterium]
MTCYSYYVTVRPGQLLLYFLRLGALGFGGPAALANAIRRDLVEQRGWITADEYESGLALAAACPGPLAYQLGVYCGYIRFGAGGGIAVAIAFGLAPFVLVTIAAALYVRFSGSWEVRALFYGIAPAVVALIANACINLGARTLRRDRLAWLFAAVACAVTVILQRELAPLFIIAGIIGCFVFAPRSPDSREERRPDSPVRQNTQIVGRESPTYVCEPPSLNEKRMLLAPAAVIATAPAKLFLFFFKTGLLVFGSGLVIVPFLKTQVVDEYHWLTMRQFLDSVAIGMISPGPVVITATFVGYLMSGFTGALAATLGIFMPSVLFTVIATPILLRHRTNRRLAGFVRGVGVTVVGVLFGTTVLVARDALGDTLTIAIALIAFAIVTFWKRIPEPFVILGAGIAGIIAFASR